MPRFASAMLSASAGNRWPPVPPAATTTRGEAGWGEAACGDAPCWCRHQAGLPASAAPGVAIRVARGCSRVKASSMPMPNASEIIEEPP